MSRLAALPLVIALCAGAARADRNDPGSLLLFPEVDGRQGSATFLTVTNVNGNPTGGSVRVHFIYVDGSNCSKANAYELLTPRDTITATTKAHAPSLGRGYCYAYAVSPSGGAVDFDYLIGNVQVLDGYSQSEYGINAMVFEGQTGEGNPTDLDGDGIRDLNGLEYSQAADLIAIPRFLGQSNGRVGPHSELVMLNLTGGTAFTTTLNFLIYNDNEEAFSANKTFYCWDRVPLTSISGAFSNTFLQLGTNDDPDEIIGMTSQEAGWILIDGGTASSTVTTIPDPAFVAVLIDLGLFASAELPFTVGEQDNGDLLPSSIFGD